MNTSTLFWAAAAAMAIAAVGFIAMPMYKGNRKAIFIVIATLIPLISVGLYGLLGEPSSNQFNAKVALPPASGATEPGKIGSVASMVDGLAERLEANPDDGKSWLLLVRSYKHLGQDADAASAYERAAALGEYDEDLSAATVESSATIVGTVALSATASDAVRPTDTLFIFARAVDGPPMPVAVLRKPAASLPLEFTLSDAQSMAGGSKLSDAGQVVVIARISRSGVATESLQELEAQSDVISVADNQRINLIIE